MDRKKQYKHKADDAAEIRRKRREEGLELQKEKRERLLNAKRVRLDEVQLETEDVTLEQMKSACLELKKKVTVSQLRLVKRAFAQGDPFIDAFISTPGATESLVGALTGADSELQLEAAWCVTNMATGTHEHTNIAAKLTGPYLVTYLASNNTLLHEQCAWALGNIAADCADCRDMIVTQGAMAGLINSLQSTCSGIVKSACFALSNLARGDHKHTKTMVEGGVIPVLLSHMDVKCKDSALQSEHLWVFTYLAASGEYEDSLLSVGFMEKLTTLLVNLSQAQDHDIQVLTPSLRCLGNLCSGPNTVTQRACLNTDLVPALGRYMHSEHPHIRKECIWTLSNMTGEAGVCESVLLHGLLTPIIQLLAGTMDIKRETAYCLCNIGCHGPEYCQELLKGGVIQSVVPFLKMADMELVHLALALTEMILRTTQSGKTVFEESRGLSGLEVLEYHNNEQIRTETAHILETYFYKEDTGSP